MAFGISAYRSRKGLCDQERAFLDQLKGNNGDRATWAAYADWLSEHDRPLESAEAKLKAGRYRVYYSLVHRYTGFRSCTCGNLRTLLRKISSQNAYDREKQEWVHAPPEDWDIEVRLEPVIQADVFRINAVKALEQSEGARYKHTSR
jgi:uncharacterized protein (TIGR02996 family)